MTHTMQTSPDVVLRAGARSHARRLAWGVYGSVTLVLLLLGYGWSLAPATAPIAPSIVLVAYVVLAHHAVVIGGQTGSRVQTIILVCGILSAAVLIWSDVIQYFGRTANNGIMVAAVSGIWLVVGIAAATSTGRIRDAVLSATLSAEIGSLANVGFILASYYILRGSALQDQFFRTEGTYDDFARSGASDFGVFVIGDLFGGTFFHLLFGGLFGTLLGAIGGVLTIGVIRITKHTRGPLPNTRLPPTPSSARDGRR
jgi:uncharacterized membrane protein